MSESLKYCSIDTNEKLIVSMHNDFVGAGYRLALNEHKLLHLLIAQKKADHMHFFPYEITSKDWATFLNVSLSTANITMKRLAKSFGEKTISLDNNKYPGLTEVPFVEFIRYDKGILRVKLNDQLAPFVA